MPMNTTPTRRTIQAVTSGAVLTLFVTACSTLPPPDSAAEASGVSAAVAQAHQAGATRTTPYPDTGWLADFAQPELTRLVDEAIQHNYSLQAAAARVDGAVAAARAAGAALKPSLALGLDAARGGLVDGSATTGLGASLSVSWEVDLWGRVRAGQAAAVADAEATRELLASARQSLAAQVAKAWFSAREAAAVAQLAHDIHQAYVDQLRIVEAQVNAGRKDPQELSLLTAQAETARDSSLQAENARDEALRSLEFLLGRYPSAQIVLDPVELTLPGPVPPGLSSEILERRPDLRAAESAMAAAFYRSREADAARLPSLTLTSAIGGSSPALGDLLQPQNLAWSLGAGLLGPIFDGGRREAILAQAEATQREAVANYGQTALAAFREVESVLARETLLARRRGAAKGAMDASAESLRIARVRYETGTDTLLDVLQIQRQHDSARITWLALYYEQLRNRVDLHLVLGGSFEPRS